MKTITNYFKLLCTLLCVSFAGKTSAQCALVAGFNYSVGPNGNVSFVNTSTGTIPGTYYFWEFGDGNYGWNSSTANTYINNGTYTVTLIATNSSVTPCADTVSQVIVVSTVTCNLSAGFSFSLGFNGLVNFNNTSAGAAPGTSYSWSFGDGSSGTGTTPAHTYTANGIYTVTLFANNNYSYTCTSSITNTIYVNSFCNFSPSFTTTYLNNGIVSFQSNSTSGSYYDTWDFGDGTSILLPGGSNPSHTYQNGVYTATLTVSNASISPTCSNSSTQVLNVTSYTCNFNPSYTAVQSTTINTFYVFNSTSTGVNANTLYFWDFGDGSTNGPNTWTSSTHTFAPGNYIVTLTLADATNSTCVNSTTTAILVSTVACVANANFSLYPTGTPQLWAINPAYPWNVTSATWSWGDGTSSNTLYTSHQYSVAGNYTICLTVTVSCGAVDSTCSSYYIYKSAEGNSGMIGVTVSEPGTATGIKAAALENNITIYPNPGNGQFNIKTGITGPVQIIVYGLLGNVIYNAESSLQDNVVQAINLSSAENGIYFVKLISGSTNFTQKIVISK